MLGESLKNDRDFVLEAVQLDGRVLEHLPRFHSDEVLCFAKVAGYLKRRNTMSKSLNPTATRAECNPWTGNYS